MANLIIYAPFPREWESRAPKGDIRQNVQEVMQTDGSLPKRDKGVELRGKEAVFLGEESHQVRRGDVVVVHGHGGEGNFTSLTDNAGNKTLQSKILAGLSKLGGDQAAEIYFFACYSALKGHIAYKYKAAHPDIKVFGLDTEVQGGLVRKTRRLMYSAVWTGDQVIEL